MIPHKSNNVPTSLETARKLLDRGVIPLPLRERSKQPAISQWQKLRREDVAGHLQELFGKPCNIGVLLGEPSGGLIDIDLDCDEAVRAAPLLLPSTGMVWGRPSKGSATHYGYRVDTPPTKAAIPFTAPDGTRLLEVRSNGGQTLVWGEYSEGERVGGNIFAEPASLPYSELERAVRRLAAAVLLACHWKEGARHELALALSGGLLRAGWSPDEVKRFLSAVAVAAGDNEGADRLRAVQDTAARISRGEEVTGWPTLAERIGEQVVEAIRSWLDIPLRICRSKADAGGNWEGRCGGGEVMGSPRYKIEGGHIWAARVEGRGENRVVTYSPLANFAALIRREISATDGVEQEIVFELEAVLSGEHRRVAVRADEFAGMNWVPRALGSTAIVTPGQNSRDQLRAAIQYLSLGEITRATVYRHLGWTHIDGKWVYLHAGGGLGPDGPVEGVEVELDRQLSNWELPPPPTGPQVRESLQRLLELFEVGAEWITVPTLLYALTCPLGQVDFSCYLTGPTGVFKTSWAMVVLSLFGYHRPTPPTGWSSTANALEGLTFAAKDSLLVIDDDAPAADRFSAREQTAVVTRLLRAQGNAVGRTRMRPDGSTTYDRPPRGGLLITGEDVPPGASIRARCLFVEVRPGDIDPKRLTQAQRRAQRRELASPMAAWIQFLAQDLEQKQAWLRERIEVLRGQVEAEHRRTAAAVARLQATAELFGQFAAHVGVAVPVERLMAALSKLLPVQAELQRQADPVERFRQLLIDLLSGGRAHLQKRDDPVQPPAEPWRWGWRASPSGEWLPGGDTIGWVDAEGIYLNPSVAYAELSRLAQESGPPLPTERTLWKLLAERELIRTGQSGSIRRSSVTIRIGGEPRRVIWVLPHALGGIPSEVVTVVTNPENPKKSGGLDVTTSEPVTTSEWLQRQEVVTQKPQEFQGNREVVTTVTTVTTFSGIPPTCGAQPGEPVRTVGDSDTPPKGEASPAVASTVAAGPTKPVVWVDNPEKVAELARNLEGITELGIDIETTGLDPDQGRVRLIQLAWRTPEGVQKLAIVDLFAFSDPAAALAPLLQRLSQVTLIGHHLAFDLSFLMQLGLEPSRPPFDTMLASQVLHAGECEDSGRPLSHDLAAVLIRELRIKLDKSLQKSNWSGELTPAQIDYAIADVQHLLPLAEKLRLRLEAGRLTQVAATEMYALLTIVQARPVRVDRAAWMALAEQGAQEARQLRRELERLVTPAPYQQTVFELCDGFERDSGINWNSPRQVLEAFRRSGVVLSDTRDETLAAVEHPLAQLLRRYRAVQKRLQAFGENWLQAYAPNGWVRPCWHQLGAESGRMSCSEPNLQQIPRDAAYRRCFVPRDGHLFIKADYCQIELRLAAKVANEERMIQAFQHGEDLHRLTAARLRDKPLDRVEKADRQLAKAVNFGLLYGMSPRGLQTYARANYDMELSAEEATRLHREFFRTYPGLQAWHERLRRELEWCGPEGTYAARTLLGRRRFIPAYHNGRPNLTEVANFQVQGLAADGLKQALALLWEHRADCPEADPVLFVHDEIVMEVSAGRAEEAREWLITWMHEGMQPLLDPVPCEVEAVITASWASEPVTTR